MVRPAGFTTTGAHRITPAGDPDFFPTQPWGGRAGGEVIKRIDPLAREIGEPACGAGHMVHGFRDYFPTVVASDLHRYDGNRVHDFLGDAPSPHRGLQWIATNPPFEPAAEFVRVALAQATRGVAILARAGFEESAERFELLHGAEPYLIRAPFSGRLPMVKGRYDPKASSAAAYAWFVWIKPTVRSPLARLARQARALAGAALTLPIPPDARKRLERPSDAAFAVA